MITGKTSTGFEFTVSEGLSKDWNFIRAYRKMKRTDDDDMAIDGLSEFIECVFCDHEQEEAFYKHLAGIHGGRVPVDELFAAVGEIMAAIEANPGTKN